MAANEKIIKITFPSITKALGEGFNKTAEHLYLLTLPVMVDLLIWLGPKFRVYELFRNQIDAVFTELNKNAPQELSMQIGMFYESMEMIIRESNLMSMMGSIPFSIPSLLGGVILSGSPLSETKITEIQSFFSGFLLVVLLGILGLLCGIFYYSILGHTCAYADGKLTLRRFLKNASNIVLLLIALFAATLVLMIPVSCLFTLLAFISISVAQIILLILFLSLAWLIIPLFFTPQAIFISNLRLLDAVKLSWRMSRWLSGPTSFFIIACVILFQGLNLIWTIPSSESWLLLIGIFGHAFIATALICASFILYQQNLKWLIENAEIIKKGFFRK